MAYVRAAAVFSITLLLGCFFCLMLAGGASADAPRMIEIKAPDIQSHLKAIGKAVEGGSLQLAGRNESAGFFYAWDRALDDLREQGVSYAVLAEEVGENEFYLVPKSSRVEMADVARSAAVISEDASSYLVSTKPEAALAVQSLPAKQRLAFPTEPSLPLRTFRLVKEEAPIQRAMVYSPVIQELVDAVSGSNLYDVLSGFSGENQVSIGGQMYTINTRYSTTQSCKDAAAYLMEQFQALGLETEYDYFNFRRTLVEVEFPVDGSDGWTIGASVLLNTTDGGQVWIRQEDGLSVPLTALYMFDEQTGLIGASSGQILRTGDGSTWEEVPSPTTRGLDAISFVDDSTGYMCGKAGTIIKSTNGGRTWAAVSSGTSVDLAGIWFVSATEGWVIGRSGLIRKTTDGGASWHSVTCPVTTDLTDIAFSGSTLGIITGLSGVILRTTDGAAWQRVTIPMTDHLYAVSFVEGTSAWACGDGGTMLKTEDGGASWIDKSSAMQYQLRDICFLDSNEGFLVGNAVLMHSVDGGTNWENQIENVRAGDVNVVATMPGTTDPEEIYIICAHYDDTSPIAEDYAPGADDNGTGTIAALEAARVLANTRFEATIKFVAFSREEQGLVGSSAYASDAYARGDSIVAALNFDMIGYVDAAPENVDLIYNGFSTWLVDEYEAATALYVPDLPIITKFMPGFASSDNASFWTYGYPSFCGIEDSDVPNPYYHTTGDRVSTVDFDFYAQVVKGAVASLVEMARIDSVTSSVPPVASGGWIKAGPNPSRGEVSFEMPSGPGRAHVVNVYDVSGRLVRTLKAATADGTAKAVWHGDDASGSKVGAGIYFFKAEGSDRATKIVLVR